MKLKDYFDTFWKKESTLILIRMGRLLFWSILIGVVAGLGAIIFYYMLTLSNDMFLHGMAGYYSPLPGGEGITVIPKDYNKWILVIVPVIGGILGGILVYTFAPEAEGDGTDAFIEAFHNKRGIIRKRIPLIKSIASALTIGSGGSAGREGPISQIGAGFGSYLATLLKLSDRDRRIMTIAGCGAGLGSIFRAPLGGALFATEVLYKNPEFEYDAILPTIISSIVGYSIFGSLFGWRPLFNIPEYAFTHPWELPLYAILGIFSAILGIYYVRIFYGMRDKFFRRVPIPPHLKPALGGIMIGILAIFIPQVLGPGYGWIQLAIDGKMATWIIILLPFVKILATSFTLPSGGSGGIFAPSLVIGGMLGGALGEILHILFPNIIFNLAPFILVGMGGFFAGVGKVPIASIIMVSEMTGGYNLLVPMMLAGTIAYLFSGKWSIYEKQVNSRVDSQAHLGDFFVDILKDIKVKDALNPDDKLEYIPEDMHFKDILKYITETNHFCFPVVDGNGLMTGIISLDDIRKVMDEKEIGDLIIAKDIARDPAATVTFESSLNEALREFAFKDIDELPVVSLYDKKRVLAMLTRRAIITAYHKRIEELKQLR
jgi:CIC family chloride channel protein